jgi:6-phosphogluconate dehydrogenase
LDIAGVTQTLKEKNIMPSMLKFGFLGLGIMGAGIVKNLLNSGHSVIVWNRTPEKVGNLNRNCNFSQCKVRSNLFRIYFLEERVGCILFSLATSYKIYTFMESLNASVFRRMIATEENS